MTREVTAKTTTLRMKITTKKTRSIRKKSLKYGRTDTDGGRQSAIISKEITGLRASQYHHDEL